MKKLFAAALGMLALAGPAAGQPHEARIDVTYSAIARGVSAGEFTYRFTSAGGQYDIAAQRRLTGLARALMGGNQDYTYSVHGVVAADGALQPQAYQHQGGRRNRLVRATFSPEDVLTTAEPHMGMGNPAATAAQKRGVVDQLTAIARLATSSGDPCNRTIAVYMDGRSRFDFVLTPNGQVNVNGPAYRGQALQCRVSFRPIAGFSDPQEPAELTFLFAPTPSGLYAPLRIEMPSDDVGVIRLEARRLTVNGADLRP